MKKILLKISFLSIFVIFYSMQAMGMISSGKLTQIKKSSLFVPHDIGEIDLFRDDNGYYIVQNNEIHSIPMHSVDPLLKTLKDKQLKKFQKCGYIQVKKNQDNKFSLISKVGDQGDGVTRAHIGRWIRKTATHVSNNTLWIISFASGQPTVFAGSETARSPEIEVASNIVACGAAIVGGASTGPV